MSDYDKHMDKVKLREAAQLAEDRLDLETAIELHEQAFVKDAVFSDLHQRRLAACYRRQGKWLQAAEVFRRIVRQEESEDEFRFMSAAHCLCMAGMWKEAAEAMDALGAGDNRSCDQDAAGKLWQRAGQNDKAMEYFKKSGRMAKVQRMMGNRIYNIEETLPLVSWRRDIIPLAEAYIELGDLNAGASMYLGSGKVERAKSCIDKLSKCLPEGISSLGPCQRMVLLEQMGETQGVATQREIIEQAKRDARNYITRDNYKVPNSNNSLDPMDYINTMQHENIGCCAKMFIQAGEYDNAKIVLERALKLKRAGNEWIASEQSIMVQMSVVSFLRGDYSSSLHGLCNIADYVDYYSAFASLIYLHLGDYDRAAEAAEESFNRRKLDDNITELYAIGLERLLGGLASLFQLAGNQVKMEEYLKRAEDVERLRGYWGWAVGMYIELGPKQASSLRLPRSGADDFTRT